MFFLKKKHLPKRTPQEIAAAVFGENTTATTPFHCATSDKFPFLSHWGSQAEADYHICGEYGELNFEFSYVLNIYTSERNRRIHRYGFIGNCLTLQNPKISMRNAYAFSGKPFRKPDDEVWAYNDKFKGVAIWSESAKLSATEMIALKKVVSWIESGLSALYSARYAIFFRQDKISIVFWKPDLYYDLEYQLNILHDFFHEKEIEKIY